MAEWTNDELQAVVSEVSRRASVDPDFRALAVKDGAAAIQTVAGRSGPANYTFRFVDNSGMEKVIPLIDPVPDLEELSEAELLAVAGGAAAPGSDFKVDVKVTPTGPTAVGSWTR